jgi:hypothetical protein
MLGDLHFLPRYGQRFDFSESEQRKTLVYILIQFGQVSSFIPHE